MERYNHWFWNSAFVMWISRNVVRFNNWLWFKQYGRDGR